MTQFYQTTLQDAIADYQDGALTAYGLVKYYIRIKFAPGWKIVLNLKNICSELELNLNTLYRALKKIKQNCDRQIIIKTEKEFCTSDNNFHTSAKTSCKFAKNDPQTTNKINASSDSPDNRSNIDHISLSDKPKPKIDRVGQMPEEEREKFLDFAMDRVNQLPTRPTLPSKWIAANFDDLYSEFKLSSAPETQKATEDKQFHEWSDLMKAIGKITRKYQHQGKWVLIDVCGREIEYEDYRESYTLEYLRKCVGGR